MLQSSHKGFSGTEMVKRLSTEDQKQLDAVMSKLNEFVTTTSYHLLTPYLKMTEM